MGEGELDRITAESQPNTVGGHDYFEIRRRLVDPHPKAIVVRSKVNQYDVL